jgi:hypothetical protein
MRLEPNLDLWLVNDRRRRYVRARELISRAECSMARPSNFPEVMFEARRP